MYFSCIHFQILKLPGANLTWVFGRMFYVQIWCKRSKAFRIPKVHFSSARKCFFHCCHTTVYHSRNWNSSTTLASNPPPPSLPTCRQKLRNSFSLLSPYFRQLILEWKESKVLRGIGNCVRSDEDRDAWCESLFAVRDLRIHAASSRIGFTTIRQLRIVNF